MQNVTWFAIIGHNFFFLIFIFPEPGPELPSGTQRAKNTQNLSTAIPRYPHKTAFVCEEIAGYFSHMQVSDSQDCQFAFNLSQKLWMCGGLAFIPEDTLGNMKIVQSLFLVPEVSFLVQPWYPGELSVSPETFKADQRHCFRGRPTQCLQDERVRSMSEELM